MKPLVVSNVTIPSISSTINFRYTGYNSYEIAIKICNEINNASDLFVINLDSHVPLNSDDNPINIVLFLRCFGIRNPILAVGQEAELGTLLRKKPEYIILSSPGTTYKGLGFHSLAEGDIPKEITGDFSVIRKFIKQTSAISEIRHEEANWWGIYRLLNVHNMLFLNEIDFQKNIPKWLSEKLNSKNGIVGRFLNSGTFVSRNSRVLVDFDATLLSKLPGFASIKSETNKTRKKLLGLNPKILYVDDMALNGWSQILKQMIYGKQSSKNFKVIVPDRGKAIEIIAEEISLFVENFHPDCILLDLRLLNESGVRYNVENLSGAIVLKELKKRHNKLPVILFTASNKIYTYRKLRSLGCDALLEKEGIDDKLNIMEAVSNYNELIKTIYEHVSFHINPVNKKIYEAERVMSKIKKRINHFISEHPPIQFPNVVRNYNFDICIIDTNLFLERDSVNKSYPAIKLLGNLYKYNYFRQESHPKGKSKFVIPDAVYNELVRKGKNGLNVNERLKLLTKEEIDLITNARWALNCVHEFIDDAILCGSNIKTKAYNQAAYADNYFIYNIIPNELRRGNSVLFISDDIKCKKRIEQEIKKRGLSSSLYRSVFIQQFTKGLNPILKQLIH